MATNKLLTIDMITNEALRLFVNNLVMGRLVNRRYDDYFAKIGGKIGKTLRVRKPVHYTASEGYTIEAGDIQDTVEDYVDLTVEHAKVAIQFTTVEEKYSLDMFSDRILKPAVNALINYIDVKVLLLAKKARNKVSTQDEAFTAAATALKAGALLDDASTPRDDDRYIVMSPAANASIVNNLKTLSQDSKEISDQYKKGSMGYALGFEWNMSQNVEKFVAGAGATDNTVTVNSADQEGSLLIVSGLADTLKKGDSFTIDGVNSINNVSRLDTGRLAQHTVKSVNSAKTQITLETPLEAGVTVSALPSDGAKLNFIVTSGKQVDVNLAAHKEAIALAIIDRGDVKRPGAESFTARSKEYDAAITCVQQYNINGETTTTKLMVDFALEMVIPEFACAIFTKAGAIA